MLLIRLRTTALLMLSQPFRQEMELPLSAPSRLGFLLFGFSCLLIITDEAPRHFEFYTPLGFS